MAEFPALPLFTDAFIGDTMHLSAAQTGAYLMLLMAAWRSNDCRLVDDDKMLARMARMDARQWAANKDTVMSFWSKDEAQKWYQRRLVDERTFVAAKREQNKQAGNASALKRKDRHSTGAINPLQPKTNQPTPTPTPSKKEPPIPPTEGFGSDPEKPKNDEQLFGQNFEDFWSQWRPFDIDKGSKSAAKKSYFKARRETDHEAIIRGSTAYADYCHAKQQRTKHAVTWINQRGWDDEYPDPKSEVKSTQRRATYGDNLENAARRVFNQLEGSDEVRTQVD